MAQDHVIAQGQEPLLRTMLGGDDVLPGGCRVSGMMVGRRHVQATYACEGGQRATVRLRHAEDAGRAGTATRYFSLAPQDGAPAGLVEAIAARVSAREAGFAWTVYRTPPLADRRGRSPTGWALVGVTLFLLVAGVARARPAPMDIKLAGGIFLAALALRLLLGAYGPFHHNGQGGLWLQGAIGDPSFLASFGPGYSELFRPVARLFARAPDTAIFVANTVFSALVPALALTLGRLAGAERLPALAVASLLAGDPIALRMAATESYLPPILALTLAIGVLTAGAARLVEARRHLPAAMLTAAACLIGAQVIRIHPTAWVPTALAPIAAAAIGGQMPWWRRARYALVAGALVGVTILAVSGAVVRGVLDALSTGAIMHPNSPGTSLWAPIAVLAVVVGVFVFSPARWLTLIAVPHVVVCLLTRDNFDVSPLWQQATDRLFVTVPLMTFALVLPRREAPIAFVATALALVGGLPAIRARTTEHHEYHWLRDALRAVPPDCQVVYLGRADDTTLFLPVFPPWRNLPASNQGADDARWRSMRNACVYYVHDSLCATPEGRPPCEAIEQQLAVTPGRTVALPAVPGHENQTYLTPRVTVWITRSNTH